MEYEFSHFCCGIVEIGRFYNFSTIKKETEELNKILTICKKERFGYAIASINFTQLEWQPILKKTGFTLIQKFINPKTERTVYIYGKKL